MWWFVITLTLLGLIIWNILFPLFLKGIVAVILLIALTILLVKAILKLFRWLGAMNFANRFRTLFAIAEALLLASLIWIIPVILGRFLYC